GMDSRAVAGGEEVLAALLVGILWRAEGSLSLRPVLTGVPLCDGGFAGAAALGELLAWRGAGPKRGRERKEEDEGSDAQHVRSLLGRPMLGNAVGGLGAFLGRRAREGRQIAGQGRLHAELLTAHGVGEDERGGVEGMAIEHQLGSSLLRKAALREIDEVAVGGPVDL